MAEAHGEAFERSLQHCSKHATSSMRMTAVGDEKTESNGLQ